MLILSLTEVARSPVRLEGRIAAEDPLWEDSGITLEGPLLADLEGRSVGEGVLVRGRIEGTIESGCRRCLTPVRVKFDEAVEMLFEPLTPEEEVDLGGEVYPLPERGDQLDLAPAIREQAVLRIPDYVLCVEGCLGLCPQCGTDLNRTKCSCGPESGESPWDALKRIKFD